MPRQAKPIPFGKYELLEKIAVGGMAEIFKARTSGVGGFEKYLAIKRILPHLSENKEFIDMLINEAKIAVRLSHANIVQIYDLGKIDDSYFIAMEYIEGKDLRAVMHRCEEIGMPLFVQHAVFITIEVCKGLEYAHSKHDTETGAGALQELNIVHRDISPQNVMISYEGEVKITDFGIAKASVNVNKTEAGVVKGKYEYMSPEQASGLPVDRRTDIFSSGIVLYEMLTGVRPFRGDSDLTILERVREAKVEPPSKYNKSVPRKLEKIVLKALSKEPDDRYQTATEFKDDLTKFFYSSTFNFTTSNLASYMKSIYSEEIRLDVTIDVDGTGVKPKPDLGGDAPTKTGASNTIEGSDVLDIESEVNKILVPGGGGSEPTADEAASDGEATEASISDDWGEETQSPDFDPADLTSENLTGAAPPSETDATAINPVSASANGGTTSGATKPNIDPLDMTTRTTDKTTADRLNPLDATSDTLTSANLDETQEATSVGPQAGASGGTAPAASGAAVPQQDSTMITSNPDPVPPSEAPNQAQSANRAVGPKIKFKPRVVKERVRGRTVNAAAADVDGQLGDDRPTAPRPKPSASSGGGSSSKTGERTVIGVRPAGGSNAVSAPTEQEEVDFGDQVTQDVDAVRGARSSSSSVTLGVQPPKSSSQGGTNISDNPLDLDTSSTSTDIGPVGAAIQEAPEPNRTAVPQSQPVSQATPPPSARPGGRSVGAMEPTPAFDAHARPRLHPMVLVAFLVAGFVLGVTATFLAYRML